MVEYNGEIFEVQTLRPDQYEYQRVIPKYVGSEPKLKYVVSKSRKLGNNLYFRKHEYINIILTTFLIILFIYPELIPICCEIDSGVWIQYIILALDDGHQNINQLIEWFMVRGVGRLPLFINNSAILIN